MAAAGGRGGQGSPRGRPHGARRLGSGSGAGSGSAHAHTHTPRRAGGRRGDGAGAGHAAVQPSEPARIAPPRAARAAPLRARRPRGGAEPGESSPSAVSPRFAAERRAPGRGARSLPGGSYGAAAARRAGAAGGRAMRLRAAPRRARSGGAAAAPRDAVGQGGVLGAGGPALRCAHPPRRALPPGPGPRQRRRALQHGGGRRLPRAAPPRRGGPREPGAPRPAARTAEPQPPDRAQTCRGPGTAPPGGAAPSGSPDPLPPAHDAGRAAGGTRDPRPRRAEVRCSAGGVRAAGAGGAMRSGRLQPLRSASRFRAAFPLRVPAEAAAAPGGATHGFEAALEAERGAARSGTGFCRPGPDTRLGGGDEPDTEMRGWVVSGVNKFGRLQGFRGCYLSPGILTVCASDILKPLASFLRKLQRCYSTVCRTPQQTLPARRGVAVACQPAATLCLERGTAPLAMNPGPSATLLRGQQWLLLGWGYPCSHVACSWSSVGPGLLWGTWGRAHHCAGHTRVDATLLDTLCWACTWGEHRPRRRELQHRSSHLPPGDLPALGSGTWGQCEQRKGMQLCSQAHLCAA